MKPRLDGSGRFFLPESHNIEDAEWCEEQARVLGPAIEALGEKALSRDLLGVCQERWERLAADRDRFLRIAEVLRARQS